MLSPLTSPNLPFPHGFFGRQGGISQGIYASLNCGPGSADDPEAVQGNRALVAAHFGRQELYTLHQCHSALCVTTPYEGRPQADAVVSNTPGTLLGILTADCAPVLLADAKNRIIGAAHAGWKGAVGGVLEATVETMEGLGANRADIHAAIGPCIAQASYEVGPEFIARLVDQDSGNARFFHDSHFDLKAYVQHRLQSLNLASIHLSPHDTCALEDDFFSYRRTTLRKEVDYGRQISCIMLDKKG